jgi:hypothetical protein
VIKTESGDRFFVEEGDRTMGTEEAEAPVKRCAASDGRLLVIERARSASEWRRPRPKSS